MGRSSTSNWLLKTLKSFVSFAFLNERIGRSIQPGPLGIRMFIYANSRALEMGCIQSILSQGTVLNYANSSHISGFP